MVNIIKNTSEQMNDMPIDGNSELLREYVSNMVHRLSGSFPEIQERYTQNISSIENYGIPDFNDSVDLIMFFFDISNPIQASYILDDSNESQEKKNLLIFSYKKACEMLANKPWFGFRKWILNKSVNSFRGFLDVHMYVMSAIGNDNKLLYDYRVLVNNMKNIIRLGESKIWAVDYKNNHVSFTDRWLLKKLSETFMDESKGFKDIHMKESYTAKRYGFSVSGKAIIEGREIDFEAQFGEKWLNRVLSKMNSDSKYSNPELIQDLHRWRIITEKPTAALRIAKILHNSIDENGYLRAQVKGNWMSAAWINHYKKRFCHGNETFDLLLDSIETKKAKNISQDRDEFRLSRPFIDNGHPSIELQFVPEGSNNERWYANHLIYEMKGEIREILSNYPRIYESSLNEIIDFFMQKQTEKDPIGLSFEHIKNHIIETFDLHQISNVANPTNIKDLTLSSASNILKSNSLYARTKNTYILVYDNETQKKKWIPQEEFKKINQKNNS